MREAQNIEKIRKNYSKAGTALIERLYGDNFLSLSGERSSDNIIQLTKINAGSCLLDIGSGVGGPAIYFAQKTGCKVNGVDVVEWNVDEANKRSRIGGLNKRAVFEVGDATSLGFHGETFDVVVSQDAWCHVPDKRRVVSEAVRVAKSSGYIAFTDWVELSDMEPDYLRDVQSAVAAPNFAKPAFYESWLLDEGCKIISHNDISQRFVSRYNSMISKLKSIEPEIIENYNKDIFSIVMQKNELILKAFRDGKIGGSEIIAQKG